MGQFALGIRSLFIKLALFVVLAALLAWILGGTLFPRPEVAQLDGVQFSGERWFWQVSVGGKFVGEARWTLMTQTGEQDPEPHDERQWREVAGPIVADGSLYFAGRTSLEPDEPWRLVQVSENKQSTARAMPDRLAVEQQLARVAAGLPLQDQQTIIRQRRFLLDPPSNLAEEDH